MGLYVGAQATVLRKTRYYSESAGKHRTAVELYFYGSSPNKDCKCTFLLGGEAERADIKEGDKITVLDFEVIGTKTKGYTFIMYSFEKINKEKQKDLLERYVGKFDLPAENPFKSGS